MKIKKDSLLFKTILFNEMSMLITGLTIIGIVIVFAFKELEKNFALKAVEKVQIIEKMIEVRNKELVTDLQEYIDEDLFIAEDIFSDKDEMWVNEKKIHGNLSRMLGGENISLFQDYNLIIIGKDDQILGDDGIYTRKDKETLLKSSGFWDKLSIVENQKISVTSTKYHEAEDKYYYELIMPIKNNDEVEAIRLEIPIEAKFFHGNKYLKLVDDLDIVGIGMSKSKTLLNLGVEEEKKLLMIKSKKIKLNGSEYDLKEMVSYGENYNVISKDVYGFFGEKIGHLVVGIKEPVLTKFKQDVIKLIALAVAVLLLLNSLIITGTFRQLLQPLEDLSEAVEEIAAGNLDRNLRLNGTSEIKALSVSMKRMVEKLKENNFILENQNLKLKDHIHQVEGIERLLTKVRLEGTDEKVIDLILEEFTSKDGFGYDRAIFFEASSEIGGLVGKKIRKNKDILTEDNLSSFDLRYETMKEIIPLIKIRGNNNLFETAISSRKIISQNTKSYKISLGSELLMGFGLNNFMILPIFDGEKNIGCILVDNYISRRRIELEDIEFYSVILLNMEAHYKNKRIETKKVVNEREYALTSMLKKIIYKRKKILIEHARMMTELYKEKKIGEKEFSQLRDEICTIRREDSILFDYSDKKEYNFEEINLNLFLEELTKSYTKCNRDIDVSLFVDKNINFLGDSTELTKAFREVVNNALNSISDSSNGRVNIVSKINNDSFVISIFDNGVGMTEKFMKENLFRLFSSGNDEASGLGMAIVDKIIRSHNGKIKIKSKVNEGTEVKIIFNRNREDKNV